jgi:acetoacetyl-CoA synthetase
MMRFLARVRDTRDSNVVDYPSLYRWSIDRPEDFWSTLWDFCRVKASRRWDRVLDDPGAMPGARWFDGARLNFAENLLRLDDDAPAIVFHNELGRRRELSHAELVQQVASLAAALRKRGIVAGDRVAAFMPNLPETVIAMLATSSIGAIWSSCSPDFGASAVVDRFGQIEPRVLFTADGYVFKGGRQDSLERVRSIVAGIPSVEHVVVVPYTQDAPDLSALSTAVAWPALLESGAQASLSFEQLPFDHPLYILFSSGTTGRPKCIVHGTGGTLLQHLKEHALHTDLRAGDRLFYFTTCGWMMWNWLVSGLASGATLVLFDGAPFHPRPEVLFDIAQDECINVFGTSARYIAALEKAGIRPAGSHDLSALRTLLSTGSPLLPESFDYVYRDIKADLQLASISGGTDIVSCFALGNPMLPVHRGELQCRGLGMKVEVYDWNGNAVVGEKGELVCTAPFPSMPVAFWNDPDGLRFRAAYFERFPGVWAHGDYAELTEHEGMVIYGRSDAVLNPGGVRIGTAEIYRQVERLPEIQESIVIGQGWKGDERIILFVVLRDDLVLDDSLIQRIRDTIRENTTPRHVPAKILQVSAIPRTRSGKIVEIAVRKAVHGQEIKNVDALENPEALDEFRNRAGLLEG